MGASRVVEKVAIVATAASTEPPDENVETNQAFRDQHGDDYKDYVRQIIEDTNAALEEEFENEKPTPHLVITTEDQGEWGEWKNSGTDESTSEDRKEMKRKLDWPTTDKTEPLDAANVNRRSADVLSGFSGKNMGAVSSQDEGLQDLLDDFADATAAPAEKPDSDYDFAGGTTLIGTNDKGTLPLTTTFYPTTGPAYEVTIPVEVEVGDRYVENYYLHELGHVLGAQHPQSDTNSPDVDSGSRTGYY